MGVGFELGCCVVRGSKVDIVGGGEVGRKLDGRIWWSSGVHDGRLRACKHLGSGRWVRWTLALCGSVRCTTWSGSYRGLKVVYLWARSMREISSAGFGS